MSEVIQAEQHLNTLKARIARRNQVQKLYKNREFKELILEGFCVQEAAMYIQQAGDPALPKDSREDCLNMALAAGHLKRFLTVIEAMGNNAENQLGRAEEHLDTVRAEEHYEGDE